MVCTVAVAKVIPEKSRNAPDQGFASSQAVAAGPAASEPRLMPIRPDATTGPNAARVTCQSRRIAGMAKPSS